MKNARNIKKLNSQSLLEDCIIGPCTVTNHTVYEEYHTAKTEKRDVFCVYCRRILRLEYSDAFFSAPHCRVCKRADWDFVIYQYVHPPKFIGNG